MKKIMAVFLGVTMLISTAAVSASEFYRYENLCEVPASVYQEPYMDSQISTTYAPWLKNIHIVSQSQLERGEYGGEAAQQIRAIAVSPVNPDIMYFGTDTSGIYRTSNGGKSWYNVNNGYPGFYSQGLLCDVLEENTVYYVANKEGVARSRDGGKTWEEVIKDPSTINDYLIHRTLLDMDAQGNLYAALPSGIYKLDRKTDTVTNLYTKFETATGNKGIYFTDIAVSSDGMHIYATANKNSANEVDEPGLYTSHDGGASWTINGHTDTKMFSCGTVAIHPEDPMKVFVGGMYTDKESGEDETYMLYESADGAATLAGKYTLYYENLAEGVAKTPVTFYYMSFGPKNSDGIYPLYIVGNKMTYNYRVSYDYGESFERILTPENVVITEQTDNSRYKAGDRYTGYWAQAYAPDMTDPGRLILVNLGPAVYKDGVVKTMSSGFSGASVSSIAVDSKMRPFFVTVDLKGMVHESGTMKKDDIFTMRAMHIDEGDNNMKKEHTFTKAVFDPNDDNHLIAYVAQNNAKPDYYGVRQSFDRGATWQPFNEETLYPADDAPYGATKVLRYDADDANVIYTSTHTSYDNGRTWEENSMNIWAISEDCSRFLGVKGSGKDTEFYISDDKCKTWTYAASPGYSSDIKGVFFDTTDKNFVWMANASSFHRVDLVTGKLVNYASKLRNSKFNRMGYDPDVPGHMIVLSSPGLIMDDTKDWKIAETWDNGESWHYVPGSFGGLFGSITFVDGVAYIGGHSGTFRYDYEMYREFLNSKIKVMLNDKEISFSVMPELTGDRAMVPMRELFEMLGSEVTWDNDTQTVYAKKGAQSISLKIDDTKALISGKTVELDAAPYIKNGKTMIPLRAASEALQISVGWDQEQKLIVMKGE